MTAAYLTALGYGEPQAEGMTAGGPIKLRGDRLQLYMNWASMVEADPRHDETVWRFVHEDLCGAFAEIGDAVRAAASPEEAAEAFRVYREAFCVEA